VIKLVRSWLRRLTRRPSEHEWAFIVALAIATRGECTRRQVGAVIVDAQNRIVGAGYNGTYRGGPNCLAGACPRGLHGCEVHGRGGCSCEFCRCGARQPCPENVPSGSSYDTGPGACIAVHAELNALLDVSDRKRLESSELYVTAPPCDGCLKILRNTPIYRILWLDEEGNVDSAVWPFGG
jgi:dCMP deaminase